MSDFSGYIDELKQKCDIVDIAQNLDCLPSHESGGRYQGECCPGGHESKHKRCFIIWPQIQGWGCYSCHLKGDVISLVMAKKKCDFRPAVDWLADHCGMPRMATRKMSPEEKAEYEAKLQEKRTVHAILTEAAHFYHQALMNNEETRRSFLQHYGLNEEIITTYQVGYATGEGLADHLKGLGHTDDQILSSGLFVKFSGRQVEFYSHRIIFPYWRTGQVHYMIGRKTKRTPDKTWEEGKYKKLQTRKDNKQYISETIQNDCLYGEDAVRGAGTVFVAEGVTDCLAMLQAGYPTTSPVTTRFREADSPHLAKLTRHVKEIYLVPDNEENEAGLKGALDTAASLELLDRAVYIVILPRPEGVDKIDVTDFLRDNGKDALDTLIAQAKTALQLKIDTIAAKKLDPLRVPEEMSFIKTRLALMSQDKAEAYFTYIKDALEVKATFVQALRKEVQQIRKQTQAEGAHRDPFLEDDASNKAEEQIRACIEKLNKKHAAVMNGGKFIILNEITEPIFNRPDITLSAIWDFRNKYLNTTLPDLKESARWGRLIVTTEAEVWLKSSDRRAYKGIIFSPGRDIPEYYNLYRGLAIKPRKGDWSLMREHIWIVVAQKNVAVYEWVLAWMARILQNPGEERPGSCIVLRGKQGSGKGCLCVNFGEIFGSHFLHISQQQQVLGRFNNHLKDALLVFIDEGFWTGDPKAESVLKAMITEKFFMIEPKGKDPYAVENHVNIMMASNRDWVVPAALEERRFCVLDMSDKRIGDQEYFRNIYDQMRNGGREAMLFDLLDLDISKVDLRTIPRTEGLLDQIEASMTTVQKFWYQRLFDGWISKNCDLWNGADSVEIEAMYENYCEFADIIGEKRKVIKSEFGKGIRKICPGIRRRRASYTTDNGRRLWLFEFPSLEECRQQFEEAVRTDIKWEEDAGPDEDASERPKYTATSDHKKETQEEWEAI